MNPRFQSVRSLSLLSAGLFAMFAVSCSKNGVDDTGEKQTGARVDPALLSNQLGNYPGAVYHNQSDSAIRWQPWTKETMDRARAANRLIFCVIAIPQQSGFQNALAALADDPAILSQIHDHYVPVLVDGDAAREMSLLAADLCTEIKQPIVLPLLMWMTCDGNPVAWIPVTQNRPEAVRELFNQSHSMVEQMWRGNSQYVLNNSKLDNQDRRARIEQRRAIKRASEEPASDLLKCLRKLCSLYDPTTRSLDETGGLFPANSLELLASAAVHPGLPADTRERCMAVTRELLKDLITSAMFDPLDGGVFVARRNISWSLPDFKRDCPSQSRAALALFAAHRATGDPLALERALGVIAFAEKSYRTAEGLFAVGLDSGSDPEKWMWNLEEVRKILGPDDAEWWIKATGMRGLGNLPSEVDPLRKYFRANTLAMDKSVAGLAADMAQPVEDFAQRFDAAKAKLLAVREARLGERARDDRAHAPSTFRMVSTYAAAFVATGDETYREKAVSLLRLARESFTDGPALRNFAVDAPLPMGDGRAFLYALAMQAILDVTAITLDDQWLLWCEDLATSSAEWFTGDQFLRECRENANLVDLPVTDLMMLFGESTAGLFSMAEARLSELERPLVASFSELATPLPTYALERPVLHTDLLLAAMARHYRVTVVHAADMPPALKSAVQRLPLHLVQRRAAKPGDVVPAGSVKILLGKEQEARITTAPTELRDALLPSGANSENLPAGDAADSQPIIPDP